MHDRHDPWKMPLSVGVSLLLVWSLFLLVPERWLEPGGRTRGQEETSADPNRRTWLTLFPPPEILIEEPAPEIPEELPPPIPEQHFQDAHWWTEGVRIAAQTAVVRDLRPSPRDSVTFFLEQLGVGVGLLDMVRPDSVLAARLVLLQRENQLQFEELKPYYQAVTRSRDYADVLSRAADMYGDFLQQEIMVPD
jgi:hypothetical protein